MSVVYRESLFSMIYEFIVARATASGGIVENFKGLDRAVKHFDAGDVQDILIEKCYYKTSDIKFALLYERIPCALVLYVDLWLAVSVTPFYLYYLAL
ncbi:hypothetical protein KUTeg_001828 [Tegillarca granosa]|uniref:Uncharacterized protein n=1 Tax=Tegillarca granosa TaxID=220873 RepID=A0ABQ9FSJ6_TEGGR|nr:hypothetical protein KUTeg_001828 [Tegillarca granosa]